MATIHITRAHNQGLDHARTYATEIVEDLSEKFGIKYQWDGDTVRFKGAGAKGFMAIEDASLELKIDLNFVLSAFKSRIEQELEAHLKTFCA